MVTASLLQFSDVSHQTSSAVVAHMCIPNVWGLCYVCIADLQVPSPAFLSGFPQDSIPIHSIRLTIGTLNINSIPNKIDDLKTLISDNLDILVEETRNDDTVVESRYNLTN